ncbi:MAG: isopentenyl-diphosphate Delta-isomerase [Sporichthyaceae bacterium]
MSNEQVVLLDAEGRPCGVADKAQVHGERTPYHFAFSSYVFDGAGRFLITQRAHTKATWPGVWTNSCCGHPAPGEEPVAAVHRRLRQELNLTADRVELALPEFSYRASFLGVEEYELCPVFLVRVDGDPVPEPSEVAGWRWAAWTEFLALAADPCGGLSPWACAQVRELTSGGHVARFLAG